MKRAIKQVVLFTMKYAGLFTVCGWTNRHSLRILCYHGIALADEFKFRPKLLMNAADFAARMEWLKREGYRVISLDEAVDAFSRGRLPPNVVVITMDDGFVGTHTHALPILRRLGFPATLYVSTYYVQKQQPAFNILVQYLFWQSGKQQIVLPWGSFDWIQLCRFLRDMPSSERPAALQQIGKAFCVDVDSLTAARIFQFLNKDEIRDLDANDIDIQLHTHRHRWAVDDTAANAREIAENREVLEPLTSRPLVHFCYPAGVFNPAQDEWLHSMGIKSATTLEPGLNRFGQSLLRLRRIIDGSNVHDLEFEAEMCGFMDVLRYLARSLRTARLAGLSRAAGSPMQEAA